VCVCVCVTDRDRYRERKREKEKEIIQIFFLITICMNYVWLQLNLMKCNLSYSFRLEVSLKHKEITLMV